MADNAQRHATQGILAALATAALTMIAAGCAGPTAHGGAAPIAPVASSVTAAGELSGTWGGSFGEFASHSRVLQGDVTLRIEDDLTFTETWRNRPRRAGTVVARGNRVTLRDSSGSRTTLTRSGDTLYGVVQDAATGAPVMVRLERVDKSDLVVTAVSDPPPTVARGAVFLVADTVRNQGARAAGPSKTTYYLSLTPSRGSGGHGLGPSRAVGDLGPGSSSNGAVTVQVPRRTAPNRYYLLACADGENAVRETDKANNCAASATTVIVAP